MQTNSLSGAQVSSAGNESLPAGDIQECRSQVAAGGEPAIRHNLWDCKSVSEVYLWRGFRGK